MEFPIRLHFKFLALAPQVSVTDARGGSLFYVRQKLLKLKEAIEVFSDESRSRKMFDIKADRVIDWSARYSFIGVDGAAVGGIQRSGMRSLWSAHYTIFGADGQALMEIEQMNPWSGLLDGFLGEIPIVGLFTGYILNPVYGVRRAGASKDATVMRLIKKRSFLESGFEITRDDPAVTDSEAALVLLSAILVSFLERRRS